MSKETITFRLDSEKRKSLDEIALLLERDRSFVLNEAINAYLEMHSWQLDHIQEGIRQADAGEFASPEEVAAIFAKWRK
ncbi:CopG family ribbon-helix-helix protein [Nostoc sp. TCL26-01]|uniref:CopG family ribbon-helix-helix protein n=1 Tax=Nostoc sp. TCL26-01 TaxID=2576904 RepID=UPI0015BA235F|nr:CopG family transcriptional regulator [Nostoc sp. TCL26-01]QLE57317.1 CopG family transcriptional regulator [Nostoc sp. TCL26-01]